MNKKEIMLLVIIFSLSIACLYPRNNIQGSFLKYYYIDETLYIELSLTNNTTVPLYIYLNYELMNLQRRKEKIIFSLSPSFLESYKIFHDGYISSSFFHTPLYQEISPQQSVNLTIKIYDDVKAFLSQDNISFDFYIFGLAFSLENPSYVYYDGPLDEYYEYYKMKTLFFEISKSNRRASTQKNYIVFLGNARVGRVEPGGHPPEALADPDVPN